MWVVTVGAHYFSYFNWMSRRFVAICTLFFMAGIANLSLSLFNPDLVYWVMHYVSIVTGHIIHLVL